jgi:hypothetical protein
MTVARDVARLVGMQLAKPKVDTSFVLSLDFDEKVGAIVVATTHTPPVNLKTALGYKLTPDEARSLAVALTAWANSNP